MAGDPRDQFGPAAEEYLHSEAHARPVELAALVAWSGAEGEALLDVGAGPGHLAFAFEGKFRRFVALDPTPGMNEVFRREATAKGLEHDAVEGYAEAMPFPDASFDLVGCRQAAHHFRDVRAFLGEVRRVLRPGGRFVLVDTVGVENREVDAQIDAIERLRDPSHVRDYRPAEWATWVREGGLEIERQVLTRRRLALEPWLQRMRVSESDAAWLRTQILDAKDELRAYFAPQGGDQPTFTLGEFRLLARRRAE